MQPETLAGRRLWIGIPGPEIDAATRAHLEAVRPGGIVLFRRNLVSLEQTRALVVALRELLGPELHVAVDQEGGLVVRFLDELTLFPGNMALGAAAFREPSMGEALAAEQGKQTARELRDLGVDVNLAPVLDLATRGDNPGIGIRSFGHWPELAVKLGRGLLDGFDDGGLIGCAKHFPGKGEASVDAHLDLPRVAPMDQGPALEPFQAAIDNGVKLIMTSHVVLEALDHHQPVTFSRAIVGNVLREKMGFRGVVMTDDLEMGAMREHFGWEETITRAAEAGHDVFCICHDFALQAEAHALITRGITEGDPRFGDPVAIAERLDGLKAGAAPQAPDPDNGRQLAEAIAGRAITVIEDGPSRLPAPAGQSIALMLPTLEGLTQVENPLRGESNAHELAEALGEGVTVIDLPTEPDEARISSAIEEAQGHDVLLVATTAARFLASQRTLVHRALASHPRAILLPLRNPFDLEVVPTDVPLHAVIPFGYRPVQLRALARTIRGEVKAYGQLPIELHRELPGTEA